MNQMSLKKDISDKEQSIDIYIEETIRPSLEYTIANVLYQYYKDRYVCVSIKNNVWFEYADKRWDEIDSDIIRDEGLSSFKGIYGLYSKKLKFLQEEDHRMMQEEYDPDRQAIRQQKIKRVIDVMINLKKKEFKNKVMTEAIELFYKDINSM